MPSKCSWLAGGLAAWFAWVGLTSQAQAASPISEIAAGATLPVPVSNVGDMLNRPVGLTAQGWFRFDFLPEHLELNLTLQYLPFSIQNISGPSGVKADLSFIGAYVGATAWGGPSVLGVRPLMTVGFGGLYDFMTFPGAPGFTSNAGTMFALRVEPGLDIPISGRLGGYIGLPMTLAFPKYSFAFWESSFSLRWKL